MKDNSTPDKSAESPQNREKEKDGGDDSGPDLGFARFKKILAGPDLGLDDDKSENSNPPEKTANKTGIKADVHEFPELHFKEGLMNMKVTKFIRSEKTRIIRYAAAIVGGLLLLSGLILLFTAATRVVDNVIFGERAMFSSFLILIGLLILITVFGRRYWHDTVLNKLNVEMEISEGKSKSAVKDKNTKKDNIEDENKSN
jgi:hypothetical protein